jgi:hypothetical protein
MQPGELPADAGAAEDGRALVADDAAGEACEDRGKGHHSRTVRDLPDGRAGGSTAVVRGDPGADTAGGGASSASTRAIMSFLAPFHASGSRFSRDGSAPMACPPSMTILRTPGSACESPSADPEGRSARGCRRGSPWRKPGGGGIMRVNASGGVAGEGHPASPGSVRCNWVVVVEYSLDERLCMEASEAAYSDEAYA